MLVKAVGMIYLLCHGQRELEPFLRFLASRQYKTLLDPGEDLSASVTYLSLYHNQINLLAVYQPTPGLLSVVQKSRELGFDRPVIVLTTTETGPWVIRCTRNKRISGYVDLNASPEDWQAILENIQSGWCVIKTTWLDQLLTWNQRRYALSGNDLGKDTLASLGSSLEGLTSQETRVVELLNQGLNNQQIADELNIHLCTVKTHIHRILSKLNMSSRTQVAAWSRHGYLVESPTMPDGVDRV